MRCSPQPSSSSAQGSVRHRDSSGAQPRFTTLFLPLKPDQPRNLASHGLCLSPAGGAEILCLISPAIRACTRWASLATLQRPWAHWGTWSWAWAPRAGRGQNGAGSAEKPQPLPLGQTSPFVSLHPSSLSAWGFPGPRRALWPPHCPSQVLNFSNTR